MEFSIKTVSDGTKELYVDEKLIASGTQEEVLLIMNLIIERESMKELEYSKSLVETAETADVVRIVRCKDCIHRDPEDKKCDCSFQARGGIFPMDDNDFCSYGEKVKI